ncbi:MAG TPA: LysE family transporter [Chitinophagaceae bacterium]|nr:LysE family transporter [Chitinophagaceae bacterium]
MRLTRIFFIGMLISFLGSLPLGTLNIATMQISISDGVIQALQFSLGSLLAEMIYVRLSLVAMDWVRKREFLFKILEWMTLAIVLILAASSFYAAMSPTVKENVFLSSPLPKIILGFSMSAVSPAQIPFWFGWSTVLLTKKILLPLNNHYNFYIVGIGLGTLIGNCVFIFGGRIVADKLQNSHHIINWAIGGIFLITAIIQIWKMTRKKTTKHKLEHPEEVTHGLEKKMEHHPENE